MTFKRSLVNPKTLRRAREDAFVEDCLGRPLVVVDPGYASRDSVTFYGSLASRIFIAVLSAFGIALMIAAQLLPLHCGVPVDDVETTYFSIWQSWKVRGGHRVEVRSFVTFFWLLILLQCLGFVAVLIIYVVLSLSWVTNERARRLDSALNALVIADFDQTRRDHSAHGRGRKKGAATSPHDEFLFANYHFRNEGEVKVVPRECCEVARLRREAAWATAGFYVGLSTVLLSMANIVAAHFLSGRTAAYPLLTTGTCCPAVLLLFVVWTVAVLQLSMVVLDPAATVASTTGLDDLPKRCTLMAVDFHYIDNGDEAAYVRRRATAESRRPQQREEEAVQELEQELLPPSPPPPPPLLQQQEQQGSLQNSVDAHESAEEDDDEGTSSSSSAVFRVNIMSLP